MFSKFQFCFPIFRKSPNIYLQICSYIQKVTLNPIETLKTSIYSPKHTQNTNIYVIFHFLEIEFSKEINKIKLKTNQRFMLIFIELLIVLRATQPNQFWVARWYHFLNKKRNAQNRALGVVSLLSSSPSRLSASMALVSNLAVRLHVPARCPSRIRAALAAGIREYWSFN